jgi:hypothetical protein
MATMNEPVHEIETFAMPDDVDRAAKKLMQCEYTYRRSGTCGCEILNADGVVFAWTVDPTSAAMIVAALNWLDHDQAQPPELHFLNGPQAIETPDCRP